MNDSDESKIDVFHLGSFFSSKVDLSQVLPAPVGNKFESSEISDPTFGGLLPYWTSDTLKERCKKPTCWQLTRSKAPRQFPAQVTGTNPTGLATFTYPREPTRATSGCTMHTLDGYTCPPPRLPTSGFFRKLRMPGSGQKNPPSPSFTITRQRLGSTSPVRGSS